jgi:hypothetical protein
MATPHNSSQLAWTNNNNKNNNNNNNNDNNNNNNKFTVALALHL